MAQFNFVADYNDQYKGYEPIPAGLYKFQITDSDVTVPSTGNGEMLVLTYEVIADPQFDGRKVVDRLCYIHPKPDTERQAKQKINTIFFLTGIKGTKDTAQLHGKTLSLLIGVKDDEKYGPQNYIKKYLPFNDREQEEESPEETNSSFTKNKKPSFVK